MNAALGPLGLLVFLIGGVVVGGMRRWWVWGWQYDERLTEIDELKRANRELRQLGFSATSAAESSIGIAQQTRQIEQMALERTRQLEQMAQEVDAARRRGEIR